MFDRQYITEGEITKKNESEVGLAGPPSGTIHIFVFPQMRYVGYDGAGIHRHLFPHAVINGTDRRLQPKHPRVLLAKERDGYRHPELDVPLIFPHLRVRPVLLHDDTERRVKHLLCLRELLLGEPRALEPRRKHWQRVGLGREAALVRVRRALNLDRVDRG